MKKGCGRLVVIGLCAAVFFSTYDIGAGLGISLVQAAKKDDLKQQNQEDQDKLDDIDDQVNELEEEQEGIDAEIEMLSNEIAELMASISLLEEEIEAKKAQIEQAKIDLAAAQEVERTQYEAMKVRVKAMYESGETSMLDIIFSSSSMQDMLNKAVYIIDNNATVRQTAKAFGVSKSTVHKDVTSRLMQVNPTLARQARTVLDVNKSERHIRGGLATREKYAHSAK